MTPGARQALADKDLQTVQSFSGDRGLTDRIGRLEGRLAGVSRDGAAAFLESEGVDISTLAAAVAIKRLSKQIDVVVHAIGILTALTYVLEPGEIIESLSLGAGNTGRAHDLETDLRIAEFKFIEWQGGPESIRQNSLFVDLFNLATAATNKRRVLYVVGKSIPLRFLSNRRALASVLSKNESVARRFRTLYGDRYRTVNDYYESVAHVVEIVDLADVVPLWKEALLKS